MRRAPVAQLAEAIGLGPIQCEFESRRAHSRGLSLDGDTRRLWSGCMSSVEIVPFEPGHAAGIARLCTTVQWPSLTDPDVVLRI